MSPQSSMCPCPWCGSVLLDADINPDCAVHGRTTEYWQDARRRMKALSELS